MKPCAFLALIIALIGFIGLVTAIEAPRKPKGKKDGIVHVLPRVGDMASVANPLQF